MGVPLSLHLLCAVIWVGGLIFSLAFMRPALAGVDAMTQARVWAIVLKPYFLVVWICIPLILASGFYMVFAIMGGLRDAGAHVDFMIGTGVLMMLMFMHMYFAPFKRLKRAVAGNNLPLAQRSLGLIRMMMGISTLLGISIVLIASGGRYIIG
jgi:uncharacterized membrane protein